MTRGRISLAAALIMICVALVFEFRGIGRTPVRAAEGEDQPSESDRSVLANARGKIDEGRRTFRFGFYHDGRFSTLDLVVGHYDTFMALKLTDHEKVELVEYLKSL